MTPEFTRPRRGRMISDESRLAPRASILRGTAHLPSSVGKYMITVPQPSGGRVFGPITAESRTLALYNWASRGGFALEESECGLTVWTLEEWEEAARIMAGEKWPGKKWFAAIVPEVEG